MSIYSSSLVSTLIGLAAAMIVLSLLVQIVQELYKFLVNSKGKAFTTVLVDMLGPWARQLYRAEALPDLVVRGPFQFWRSHPRGVLLPLERKTLVAAMERTAPSWVQTALRHLRLEIDIQNGTPRKASKAWRDFIERLREFVDGGAGANTDDSGGGPDKPAVPRPPGYWTAREVFEFLEKWKDASPPPSDGESAKKSETDPPLDARLVTLAFRSEFLPHVLDAERDYPQLTQNFEYAYRRRNRRHAFTIALLIAFVFNLPFHRLWDGASRLSPEEAVAFAQQAMEYQAAFALSQTAAEVKAGDREKAVGADATAPDSPDDAQAGAPEAVDDAETAAPETVDGAEDAAPEKTDDAQGVAPDTPDDAKDTADGLNATIGGLLKILMDPGASGQQEFSYVASMGERLDWRNWREVARYLFGCLITAILASFGAPFWNDIAKSLLRMQQGGRPRPGARAEVSDGPD